MAELAEAACGSGGRVGEQSSVASATASTVLALASLSRSSTGGSSSGGCRQSLAVPCASSTSLGRSGATPDAPCQPLNLAPWGTPLERRGLGIVRSRARNQGAPTRFPGSSRSDPRLRGRSRGLPSASPDARCERWAAESRASGAHVRKSNARQGRGSAGPPQTHRAVERLRRPSSTSAGASTLARATGPC